MVEKKIFPMVPETNWWNLRSQFQKTLPSVVSVSYLKSLLNLKSDQSARNIISPLRQMGIIDEDGKPTPRANEWRSDAKYADVCKAIVNEIYPPELADLFPEAPIDIASARSWFMDIGAIGASAASKIAATYALLRVGQVKVNVPNVRTDSGVSAESKKAKKKPLKKSTAQANNDVPLPKFSGETLGAPHSPSVHVDLQIHISPDASAEQIDSIFASMAKHLYGRE